MAQGVLTALLPRHYNNTGSLLLTNVSFPFIFCRRCYCVLPVPRQLAQQCCLALPLILFFVLHFCSPIITVL